jgi:branched-chain amino acid transport system permease protein
VQAFGVNVPVMVMLTYGAGAALAAFAGVLAAPVYPGHAADGQNLIIVVFAVVVIGGMGSIMGSILTGLGLGVVEGLTKVFYPEASIVVFVIMVIVLIIRPPACSAKRNKDEHMNHETQDGSPVPSWAYGLLLLGLLARPSGPVPVFVMKLLCFASSPAPSTCCWASPACCPSAMRPSWVARPMSPAGSSSRGSRPNSACWGTAFAGLLGLVVGLVRHPAPGHLLRDDHAGLAQMLYFVCLQAPFTGGEDGLQGVPRGKLFGLISLPTT